MHRNIGNTSVLNREGEQNDQPGHNEELVTSVPVAQWLEHCVSSAKVVGSIPREHMYWQKYV